jgi:hypothetical protein
MSEDHQRALREAEAAAAEAEAVAAQAEAEAEALAAQALAAEAEAPAAKGERLFDTVMASYNSFNEHMLTRIKNKQTEYNADEAKNYVNSLIEILILLKNMIDHIDNTLLDGFSKNDNNPITSNEDKRNDYVKKFYYTIKQEEVEKLQTEFAGKEIDFKDNLTSDATFKNLFLFSQWGIRLSDTLLKIIDAPIYIKNVDQANSEREIISLFKYIATAKSEARNRNLTYNEQLENHPKDPSDSDTHLLLITKRHWLESEKKVLHHEVEWATAMIKRNDNMINKKALDIAIAAYNAADQRLKATEEEDAIVYKKIEIEAAEAEAGVVALQLLAKDVDNLYTNLYTKEPDMFTAVLADNTLTEELVFQLIRLTAYINRFDHDLSEALYFQPSGGNIVPKQPLYHKYDPRYAEAYNNYIRFKESRQDEEAKKALDIVNEVKVKTANMRDDIRQAANTLCRYINTAVSAQSAKKYYTNLLDTNLLKKNNEINFWIRHSFVALEAAKLKFNSYRKSVEYPNMNILFGLHDKLVFETKGLNKYIIEKGKLYDRYTDHTELAKLLNQKAAEADAAASIQIEAAEDPKNSSRGARDAQTRLNRFDARARTRAAATYITNLLKRKIGGMVTRKKKYRKRNKTKRNKRQKKRYTKKYNMRY